jgi:transposase
MSTKSREEINLRTEVKGIKINVSEYARTNNISWATAKRRINGVSRKKRTPTKEGVLSEFKEIIDNKVKTYNTTATAIHYFIKEKGYSGSLSTVIKYVKPLKNDLNRKAVIRIETTPGLQGQVDWKENMSLISKYGEVFKINIFLYILAYSKLKYIELTIDKTQSTLFNCLTNAFKYCDSRVPEEMLFDNMKTVVQEHNSSSGIVTFNPKFEEYAKNCGFKPIACRPYNPKAKGLVENLAKLMERLVVYNEEFTDLDELKVIVTNLNKQLNSEVSQATNEVCFNRFENKEKEYLNYINLEQFTPKPSRQTRKVSNESMIVINKNKYSVPVDYIDRIVEYELLNNELYIYYKGNEIVCHSVTNNRFNYKENHLLDIIKSSFPYDDEKSIKEKVENRLKGFDCFNVRGKCHDK